MSDIQLKYSLIINNNNAMKIDKILILFTILLLVTVTLSQQCQNGGVSILVRSKATPYELTYKCLCPFNYRSSTCSFYRGILCSLSKEKIISYNPKKSKVAQLQFQMQCYLTMPKHDTEPNKNNYFTLPMTDSQIQQYIKDSNYFISKQYDIIWANDTTLFDAEGNLIKNQSDDRAQTQILESYPHYQFTYNKSFLNYPAFNTQFKYKLYAHKFINQSIKLESPQVVIQTPKIDIKNTIVGRFNVTIQKQYEEYRVSKLELTIYEQYGGQDQIYHRVGMNTAKWRVVNPNYQKGQILKPDNSKMPTSFWIVFIFLSLFGLISGSRFLIKVYKRWRHRKQAKQMDKLEEQTEPQLEQKE